MRRGVTLIEVLTTLGLITLLYAILAFTTVQISRSSRMGMQAASDRRARLQAAEQLRWQLRCLFVPEGVEPLRGGRLPDGDQQAMSFLTSYPAKGRGVVEACYRLMKDDDGRPFLAYREFPHRDPRGLRPWTEQEQAEWRLLDPSVKDFQVEFSADGKIFQREWDGSGAPKAVRVLLVDHQNLPLALTVFVGVSSSRW